MQFLIPRPLDSEHIVSPIAESSRDFMFARYTADVGPAQVDQTYFGSPGQPAIGVVHESPNFWGAAWQAIVPDDGRLLTYDALAGPFARHASCALNGTVFVYEDRATSTSPNLPPYYGTMMMRWGLSVFSQPVSPLGVQSPSYITLDQGSGFYEDEWEESIDGDRVHVFAPTVCMVPRESLLPAPLAFWNVGHYDRRTRLRSSIIRGAFMGGTYHRTGGPIPLFDLKRTSGSTDRFNANLHAFECEVYYRGRDAPSFYFRTVGLVNSNANGLINITIFDTRSGGFDPREIYSSELSPTPGIDPAGNSGGGHPIVTWIGRDDGDVHVLIAQPSAASSAGTGSVFANGTHIVANQPGSHANRRPSVANFHLPPYGPWFVVAWESLRAEMKPHPYSDIKARVFDYTGQPWTDEFTISSPHSAGRAAPHVFPLPDLSGIYTFWMDDSGVPEPNSVPSAGGWRVKGRRWTFDPVGGASASGTP